MDYKIDWLTLTLKPENASVTYIEKTSSDDMCPLENWLFSFLNLNKIKHEFLFKCGSVQHYNFMYTYNGISIAFANAFNFPNQGLMIRFSAEGIAFYEKYRKSFDKDWNFIAFLKEFFSLGIYGFKCKCTRIDIAFDDISYDDNHLISLDRISKAVKRGEVVTLFRRVPEYDKNEFIHEITHIKERNSKGDLLGETIEFGNRKSAVFLRFYDKLKEQLKLKREVDEKIKHWVRMEFEFKNTRAMAICDSLILLDSNQFGKYFSAVINRYLRFVVPHGERRNYYRCNTRKWWRDVVGTVEKARLAENKAVKNRYKSAMRWLKRTVYPTLWAVLHCKNVDEFLTDVQQAGFENQTYNHEMIVNDYISDKQEEEYKGIDIHKLTTNDFTALVKELEATAYKNDMLRSGMELCKALEMEEVFKTVHKTRTIGMTDKNIEEYQNRQMIIHYELAEIDNNFRLLATVGE